MTQTKPPPTISAQFTTNIFLSISAHLTCYSLEPSFLRLSRFA